MRYTYDQPTSWGPGAEDQLHGAVATLNLPGFAGISAWGGEVYVEFPDAIIPLTDADKARLDATIAAYIYTPPAPPPDIAGFLRAIPLDSSVPAADLSAIVGDPRATMFTWAIQIGDWTHAQARYSDLKATPPTGATVADVESFGALAASYHIPVIA